MKAREEKYHKSTVENKKMVADYGLVAINVMSLCEDENEIVK